MHLHPPTIQNDTHIRAAYTNDTCMCIVWRYMYLTCIGVYRCQDTRKYVLRANDPKFESKRPITLSNGRSHSQTGVYVDR